MRRRILARREPGGCALRLTNGERALLAQLPTELAAVLTAVAEAGLAGGAGNVVDDGDLVDPADQGTPPDPAGSDRPGSGHPSGGGDSAGGGSAGGTGSVGEGGSARSDGPSRVPMVPPSLKRLFPPAYTGDDEAERNFAAVSRADLLEHHRQALQILAETAGAKSLDEEQLQGWLTAINDVRLVLGTVLDISENDEALRQPVSQQMISYYYLSGLQGELVDFLSDRLPDPVPGADDQIPEDPWGEPLGGLRWDGTPQPGSQ